MAGDDLARIAAGLTRDEASILAHYTNNERPGLIAQVLEIDRAEVDRVIRDIGHNHTGYARNLLAARIPAQPEQTAQVDGKDTIASPGPRLNAAIASRRADALTSRQLPKAPAAKPAAAARPPVAALPVISRPVEPAPAPVAEPATAGHAETPVEAAEEEPVPVTTLAEPPARAADLPLEPAPDADLAIEDLLTHAEGHELDFVRSAAKAVRTAVDQLNEQLAKARKAAIIKEQIADLDAQIAEKISARDRLRAKLQELLDSDVVVSATSGRLREEKTDNHKVDTATIRAWAIAEGMEVHEGGVLPRHIKDAYVNAHPGVAV